MTYFSKWVYDVYKNLFYLPGVDMNYMENLAIDKAKLSIFAILIDDLADNPKLRNKYLLENAIKIPWDSDEKQDVMYLEITRKLWLDIIKSIKKYPRYDEFENIFNFDMDRFLDSIKYGFLINTSNIGNVLENGLYSYQNMMIMVFLDMDLMCSPIFNKNELNKFRPIAHWIQDICHVGNILSTYEREVMEEDFSSPIIALGLEKGLFTKEDVIKNQDDVLKWLVTLVPIFQARVEEDFQKIQDHVTTVKSIDLNELYSRLKKIYKCFLERPNYWEISDSEPEEREKQLQPITRAIPEHTLKWVRI